MLDALGRLLTELRDDVAFAAWHGGRVRGEEPKPATATTAADARGPGEFARFVVINTLTTPRQRRVPVQRPRYGVNVYGLTPQDAMAGYVLASDAIHETGSRMHGAGATRIGIWNSWDDTGGTADRDPDTGQPVVRFVVQLTATTQAVA